MEETLNSLNFIGKCPCPFQGCVPATSSLALTVDTKQTTASVWGQVSEFLG